MNIYNLMKSLLDLRSWTWGQALLFDISQFFLLTTPMVEGHSPPKDVEPSL